ncbi:MAG TPA: siroheme synthase [Novosphingobium sp.]|nr:siroheme synthase [Novosphingobium sp.]
MARGLMHSLPLFHRVAGRRVIVLGEGAAAEAKRRLIERAGAAVAGEDDDAAKLAFVAFGAAEADETAAARLRARGVLVNVVDRPELCDFTTPSLLERGPMLVAIGSGGVSAGLTKALRLRLEEWLPESIGRLATLIGEARDRIKRRLPDPDERRRVLDAAVSAGGALDLLADHDADAVEHWLDNADVPVATVHDFVVASDDPDDLTLRQARLLGTADVIRHDGAVPPAILTRARADAERRTLDDPRPDHGVVVVLRR